MIVSFPYAWCKETNIGCSQPIIECNWLHSIFFLWLQFVFIIVIYQLFQDIAKQRGLHSVLWLYGEDRQVTEAGTMNIFFIILNENGGKK